MAIKKFPSDDFPALPSIRVDAPAEWQSINPPDSIMALIKDKGEEFSPNVVVSVYKVDAAFNFEQNQEQIIEYIQGLDNIHVFNNRVTKISDLDWQVVEYIFRHQQAGMLVQMQATTLLTDNDAHFAIRYTGTAVIKEEDKNVDYVEIQRMLGTIRVS